MRFLQRINIIYLSSRNALHHTRPTSMRMGKDNRRMVLARLLLLRTRFFATGRAVIPDDRRFVITLLVIRMAGSTSKFRSGGGSTTTTKSSDLWWSWSIATLAGKAAGAADGPLQWVVTEIHRGAASRILESALLRSRSAGGGQLRKLHLADASGYAGAGLITTAGTFRVAQRSLKDIRYDLNATNCNKNMIWAY